MLQQADTQPIPKEFLLPNHVAQLIARNSDSLKSVEETIETAFESDSELLTEISAYLLKLGGKRIRPLLTLTSAQMFGTRPSNQVVTAAAGIELIHMATLLHDDIIDQSPTRRHHPSAYAKYGIASSLLAGDFLLARAFGLCARLDSFVIQSTERACVELTEGELGEGTLDPKSPKSLEDYFWVIRRKTASLFGLATAVGSHLSGAGDENVALMREFGNCAGIAFQIVDDILDITADENLLGKPSGTDLKQKTPSILNILWLSSGDPLAREFFAKESISEQESRAMALQLRSNPIVAEARRYAEHYAAKARSALNEVQHGPLDTDVRADLISLIDYTLERCQ